MSVWENIHVCNPLDFSHMCLGTSQFTKEKGWRLESFHSIPTAKGWGEGGSSQSSQTPGRIPWPWHSLPTVRHTEQLERPENRVMGDVGRGVCAWNPQVDEAHQWPDIKKGSLQPPWGLMSLIAIPKSPTKEKKHCRLVQAQSRHD